MQQNVKCFIIVAFIMLPQQLLCSAAVAPPVAHHQQLKPGEKSHMTHMGHTARLLDHFNNQYPDGSYEFRYELDDGTARYERGYFAYIDEVKTLMVVGYYSYRLPDGRYLTVFYNADQHGYKQNQSITPEVYPSLPRSIEVPMPMSMPMPMTKTMMTTANTSTKAPKQPQKQQQHRNTSTSTSTSRSRSSSMGSSSSPSTPRAPTRKVRL